MPVKMSVKSDIRKVLKELDGSHANSKKAIVAALNRVGATVVSRGLRKVTEVFNIRLRDIKPYITFHKATSVGRLSAHIRYRIKAVPQELFGPKVKMQRFTMTRKDGTTFKRRLPAVYFKRYRAGQFKYMKGVFPLRTRTTGKLLPGDKLRRRIGTARDRLTAIRFYIVPPHFVVEVLIPEGKKVVGERFILEFRSAYRKFVSGRNRLVP